MPYREGMGLQTGLQLPSAAKRRSVPAEVIRQRALADEHRERIRARERQGKTEVDIFYEEMKLEAERKSAAKDAARAMTEAAERASSDRARAVARMYDTIQIYDDDAHRAKLSLLDQELKEFEKLKIAETDIHRYKLEQMRQLDLEYAQRGDDIAKGFGTMFEDMKRDRLTLGGVGGGTARSIHSEWVGAFQSMGTEGASWKDSMEGFFTNVGKSFSNMMAQMAAEALLYDAISPAYKALASGIAGAFSGGGGGGGGTASSQQFDYQGVESYHGGGVIGSGPASRNIHRQPLQPNERLIVGQVGERVTPAGSMPAVRSGGESILEVRIQNDGSPAEITSAQSYMLSDRRIIDVSIRAAGSNMTYQKAHGN